MNREAMIDRLRREGAPWDIVVIGGGATGLGCAVDAAARGYRAVLLEQADFGKGTSSRSTKLAHGGVRYLRQGQVGLVVEALRERARLMANAPHLVRPVSFVVPTYQRFERATYGLGLGLYDILAGRCAIGRSRVLTRAGGCARVPGVNAAGLRYFDACFDDARLAVNLAATAADLGAVVINYARVTAIVHEVDAVVGVRVSDSESGESWEIRARAVINAAGVFADGVRRLDDPSAEPTLTLSRGAHVVLDGAFLGGDTALLVPRTDDGRVVFAIPYRGRVLVGTTDTRATETELEPHAREDEIDFLLAHAARYLARAPERADVRSAFAGLRPLLNAHGERPTARLSREHRVLVSARGLVTIVGGKWTTYRKMAEDTVDQAAHVGGLEATPSPTRTLRIHGNDGTAKGPLARYGSDAARIEALAREDPALAGEVRCAPGLLAAEVAWAVREEMARTVEDVLARRTGLLFVDARAAIDAAPAVAQLIAAERGRDAEWVRDEAARFAALAARYLPA
jgi:glycerol-3-phosphate dehydrogenase